jgi:hypothetical protein
MQYQRRRDVHCAKPMLLEEKVVDNSVVVIGDAAS